MKPQFIKEEIKRTEFSLILPSGGELKINMYKNTPQEDINFVARILTIACKELENDSDETHDAYIELLSVVRRALRYWGVDQNIFERTMRDMGTVVNQQLDSIQHPDDEREVER